MGRKIEKWDEVRGGTEQRYQEFLDSKNDSFAILQLNRSDEARNISFMSYDFIERQGLKPEINFYELTYTGLLHTNAESAEAVCESLFVKFNTDRPEDFKGHSMSVSDVIAINRQGEVNYYFVDSFGFKELPGFDSGRNPLRGMEDQMEQNDNQLDGVINNLPEKTITEKEAKTSIVEKLKAPVPEHEKKTKSCCNNMEL